MTMPLSQVLSYNTEHLIDASAHWQALADQREEVFGTVHNQAQTLPWEGLGADALHERTGADYSTALESAGNLRQAAMVARDGASTLTQMHSRVLYTVEDIQADGFAPTEDLSVMDTRPSTSPAVAAQRQAQAQSYSGQLRSQVTDLVAHDTQVGADMHNATAGEGKIQFVDHSFKQDPFNQPIPEPPGPAPAGKAWEWKPLGGGPNGSWSLIDKLAPCDGGKVFWDGTLIAGGGIGAIFGGVPGIVGGIGTAGGAMNDLKQCELP